MKQRLKIFCFAIVISILYGVNINVYAATGLSENVIGKGQVHRDTFTIDDRPVYIYGTAEERESGYIERISTGTEDTYYDYHIYKATAKSGWKFIKWATYFEGAGSSAGQNSTVGLKGAWYYSDPTDYTIEANVYSNTIRVNNGPDASDYSELYRLYAIFSPTVTCSVDSHGKIKTGNTYTSWTDKIELVVSYGTNSETIFIDNKDVGYEIDKVSINGKNQDISDDKRGEIYSYYFSNVTSPQSISATFRPVVYKIKFDGNTNTSGNMNVQEFSYGTEEALNANEFKKSGYEFDGWNTMADRTGTEYADKQKISNLTTASNQIIALYAQWKASNLTGNVDIIGEEKVNKTLEAKVIGTNNTGILKYQWLRDGENITGENNAKYTLVKEDANKIISCIVTSTVQTGSIKASTGRISDKYIVEYSLTNVTTDGKAEAIIGEEYNAFVLADEKYKLPIEVNITVDDIKLDTKSYSYDNVTGKITIPANKITGNIKITVEAIKIPEYKVIIDSDNGVTITSNDDLDKVLEGKNVTLKIKAKLGFKLTNIKIDDEKQTLPLTDDYLLINNIRENITITIKTEKVNLNNPNTGDNILIFVAIFVISLIGIFATLRINKKEINR